MQCNQHTPQPIFAQPTEIIPLKSKAYICDETEPDRLARQLAGSTRPRDAPDVVG